MGVDTNILDYINVLNQTQIDKEDLPEFWYRVVDNLKNIKVVYPLFQFSLKEIRLDIIW